MITRYQMWRNHRECQRFGDDLGAAHWSVMIKKADLADARDVLERQIVSYYINYMPVSEIARRSHTARSLIYKILHDHHLLNTQGENDHGSGTEEGRATDSGHLSQDQSSARMA